MAADVYELFRLTLIKRRHGDLFESFDQSRQEYIESVLSRRIEFEHHTTPFSYVPLSTDLPTRTIVGKLGRAIQVPENAAPEEEFEEQVRESWKASVIAIDPSSTEDGQKISMLRDRKVGKPFSVLRSLVKHINLNLEAPYTLEVQPIFSSETFWDFAAKNKGNITSLTFDFVVPNGLWNTDSHIKDDLRSAGETMNAEEIVTTIKSEQGIRTDSKPVAEAISYIENGSGSAVARTRDGATFNSTTKSKRAIVQYEFKGSPRSALARALRSLAKILDHE
ncbi:hypothetical protein IPV08_20805 [Methylobacterium sp. SD274]|uniref:hypothetical protein n=1 Tax=Methylobacterium sp. SD274 TaxID=2782009 RepID=UPI001A95FCDC|nr:hypothetical protein [Methylobacterium sp. SD274]MBO1022406.1 hypothetical protein [Methylobacterium sp. SD274]